MPSLPADYSHSYGGQPAGKQKVAGSKQRKKQRKMAPKPLKKIFGR